MFKARTTTALLLTLPALALGACGGSDSDSNSDEDQITSMIETVAADPVAICDHVTAADLRELGGKEACVRLGRDAADRASEVTIEEITVNGERATARFDDSEDGATTIQLVKEEDAWKIAVS